MYTYTGKPLFHCPQLHRCDSLRYLRNRMPRANQHGVNHANIEHVIMHPRSSERRINMIYWTHKIYAQKSIWAKNTIWKFVEMCLMYK